MLDKINVDEIQTSSRMYPAIIFDKERDAGDQILDRRPTAHDEQGNVLFQNLSFESSSRIDKVALLCDDHESYCTL